MYEYSKLEARLMWKWPWPIESTLFYHALWRNEEKSWYI